MPAEIETVPSVLSQDGREESAIEWCAVEDMVELARWSWTEVDVGYGQFEFSRELTVLSLNLCVVFGLSVLERALLRSRSEGYFSTRDSSFFGLMRASQDAGFAWRDAPLLDRIRNRRNEIAHQRARFSENECLVMLLAIAEELEEFVGVAPQRRLFMHSRGLYARAANGRRFRFNISFPADVDQELQDRVFRIAEDVAKNMTESMLIRDELDSALADNGINLRMAYLVDFEFEADDREELHEA
ncbi:MAG: hypothetical protein M9928_17250 [Anaerolineae bacterium]|nr:hypothetical protein [Anaerolineae bacterium]MCO5206762.1 hypothetical protein [Anaerolineae bacterium]